jgi:hypothetical protein
MDVKAEHRDCQLECKVLLPQLMEDVSDKYGLATLYHILKDLLGREAAATHLPSILERLQVKSDLFKSAKSSHLIRTQ